MVQYNNDSKHTSKSIKEQLLNHKKINGFESSSQSPDLSPTNGTKIFFARKSWGRLLPKKTK